MFRFADFGRFSIFYPGSCLYSSLTTYLVIKMPSKHMPYSKYSNLFIKSSNGMQCDHVNCLSLQILLRFSLYS